VAAVTSKPDPRHHPRNLAPPSIAGIYIIDEQHCTVPMCPRLQLDQLLAPEG
jgi:hypothetical protein